MRVFMRTSHTTRLQALDSALRYLTKSLVKNWDRDAGTAHMLMACASRSLRLCTRSAGSKTSPEISLEEKCRQRASTNLSLRSGSLEQGFE